MKPFTEILHPTDFSDCADAALERALDLRQQFSGKLTLMHVYPIPLTYSHGYEFDGNIFTALEAAARSQMVTLKERANLIARDLAGDRPVPEIATKVVMGSPYHEVVKEAQDGHYDLIVIGTHGYTGFKHLFLGSVAERVVRLAPCAVLTVRDEEPTP